MVELDAEAFEELVMDAIDEIPEHFARQLTNLVFLVEDEPDEQMLKENGGEDLLGLYDGMALTDGDFFGYTEPNRIFIFRGPTLRMCERLEEVAQEVRVTVFHEVAHHFGIDDDALWEYGWA